MFILSNNMNIDVNIKQRKNIFDKFQDNFDYTVLQKQKELGRGGQGKVYSYCRKNTEQDCVAVKKIYIEAQQSKYLSDPFGKRSLLHSTFIELASMKMINQFVLSNVCPNFILHYTWRFKSRSGICDDLYPNVAYFFNEYISNSQTFTEWIKKELSQEEFYNAYFQIIYALYTLQLRLNMTHLDLHTDNIIVQKVPKGGYWEYTIGENTYYVPNLGYIFYINDFGHAWIPNVLKSWFIRQRYNPKRIKSHFDLMILYRSHINKTKKNFPKSFQKVLLSIIKSLRNGSIEDFPEIIKNVWLDKYKVTNNNNSIIDKFNINNSINISEIPVELRPLLK